MVTRPLTNEELLTELGDRLDELVARLDNYADARNASAVAADEGVVLAARAESLLTWALAQERRADEQLRRLDRDGWAHRG